MLFVSDKNVLLFIRDFARPRSMTMKRAFAELTMVSAKEQMAKNRTIRFILIKLQLCLMNNAIRRAQDVIAEDNDLIEG